MPRIELHTEIASTPEICFDLSRSIDLHMLSTGKTKEKAIAGRTSGLIGMNETVTWKATHFGVRQKLTSKITAFDRPNYFVDEQVKGIFKSIHHQHIFKAIDGGVVMTDIFEFESPFGFAGRLFNQLVLTRYLRKFIAARNAVIKNVAESGDWTKILNRQ